MTDVQESLNSGETKGGPWGPWEVKNTSQLHGGSHDWPPGSCGQKGVLNLIFQGELKPELLFESIQLVNRDK